MAERVRLKSGISTVVSKKSARVDFIELASGLAKKPLLACGVTLIVRLISAVKTEEEAV